MRKLELIPICIGTHEDCAECDGNPDGGGSQQQPCSFRARCIGFQKHLAATGEDEEQHINIQPIKSQAIKRDTGWKRTAVPVGRTFDEFNAQMSVWARQYGAPEAEAEQARPSPTRASKTKSRQSRKASGGRKKLNDKLKKLVKHFLDKVGKHVPRKLIRNSRTLVLPGDIYLVDRMASGYIVLKGRTKKGIDRGIANIHPRNRSETLSIQLGCATAEFLSACSKEARAKFKKQDQVHPITGGFFGCEVRMVGREQCAQVAKALGKMVEQGIIRLPKD